VTRGLRLIVSVGLLSWVGWQTDWGQVGRAFTHLHVGWWLTAVLMLVLAQLVSARRWQLLAAPLGFPRSLQQMTAFYFIGMYFNLVLPTSVGGDVVRAWYLDGRSGRRLAAFASVLLDRLSGLGVLLAVAGVGVLLAPAGLPNWARRLVWGACGCALLGLTALPLVARLGAFLPQRTRRNTNELFVQIRAMGGRIILPRLLLTTTLLSIVVQVANVVLVGLVGRAIAAPVPAAYYWVLVPVVSLLTLLPVSVNGMGVREGAMVLFLTPLGVDQGTALTLAFLWFAVTVVVSLAGGVVYLVGQFPTFALSAGEKDKEQSSYGPVGYHSDQGRAGQSSAAA
jgi:uncharacterized membrane protein YbhN (UPF0104 family)